MRGTCMDARMQVCARSRAQIDIRVRCIATSRATPAAKSARQTSSRQHLEQSLEQPAASPAAASAPARSPAAASSSLSESEGSISRRNIILLDGDILHSTNNHRAIVGSGLVLMGSLFAVGASRVHDAPAAAAAVAAASTAFLTADLLSGVYHWAVDNYGDGSTPVFGSQIAGFQAHHQRPWTITERQFANNVHRVFLPALPVTTACLAASPLLPGWASIWLSSATFFTVMSQQFHAWSHMKRSELPSAVIVAQDAGLLISRKAHGAHHKAPFEGNYCIVSGFWNPLLDAEGADEGAFRRLERALHSATGVEPRCWSEPSYEIESSEAQAPTL